MFAIFQIIDELKTNKKNILVDFMVPEQLSQNPEHNPIHQFRFQLQV